MADTSQNGTTAASVVLPGMKSRLSVIRDVTRSCLASLTEAQLRDVMYTEHYIIQEVASEIQLVNTSKTKGETKWRVPDELSPAQIADIMAYTYPIVRVMTAGASSDPDYDLLAMYQEDGIYKGTYSTSDDVFRKVARSYNYTLTIRGVEEVMAILRDNVERVHPCVDPSLIAVNNGIFDYDKKVLMDFDPKYVFLTKSLVDYNSAAQNVVIHNPDDGTDWDVESWMHTLSDDDEIVDVLWEIIGAIIRPLVPWNVSAWFYSEAGNNGKGTLCELMRQMCGDGNYASIPLADFGKDFMLEPLTHSSAIIVDENDVGTFIDKAANLKAVITGDTIPINRKFKQPIAYKFRGFMVQCLNEMPRIKDKSDSFFRRQLFVPFTKCFTGIERKYIKEDYLHRKEVLEYVMKRVLHMNYFSLSVPAACVNALEEYKDFVDPVREFLREHMPLFKWDLLPSSFLYDVYVAWYKKTMGNVQNMKSQMGFMKDVKHAVETIYPAWGFIDRNKPMNPGDRMDCGEPLIDEYNLKDWMNPYYAGSPDIDKRCVPVLKRSYRGIYRLVRQEGSDVDNLPDEDET